MDETDYKKAFHQYTNTLENVNLNKICMDNLISGASFIEWIRADKVRWSKLQEVTEARVLNLEKAK